MSSQPSRRALLGLSLVTLAGCSAPANEDEALRLQDIYLVRSRVTTQEGRDITNALRRAIEDAVSGGGGLVRVPGGRWTLSEPIDVPPGIRVQGAGSAGSTQGNVGTTVEMLTAEASVRVGDRTTRFQRGFGVADLELDGGDIATTPLHIGRALGSTFTSVRVTRAVGEGVLIEAAQNCVFTKVSAVECRGWGIVLDSGAGGNLFDVCNTSRCAAGGLRIRETFGDGPYGVPSHNGFTHCVFERPEDARSLLVHDTGRNNTFSTTVFAAGRSNRERMSLIRVNAAAGLRFSDCQFSGGAEGVDLVSAIDIRGSGAKVYLTGLTGALNLRKLLAPGSLGAIEDLGVIEETNVAQQIEGLPFDDE